MNEPYVDPGSRLTAVAWNGLIDWVKSMLVVRGAPPLAIQDGVIHWAGEFKVSHAMTTSVIPARPSTLQMGQGTADLYISDPTGLLKPKVGSYISRTVWSDLGAETPSGVLIKVLFFDGKWQIFNADCVGS